MADHFDVVQESGLRAGQPAELAEQSLLAPEARVDRWIQTGPPQVTKGAVERLWRHDPDGRRGGTLRPSPQGGRCHGPGQILIEHERTGR